MQLVLELFGNGLDRLPMALVLICEARLSNGALALRRAAAFLQTRRLGAHQQPRGSDTDCKSEQRKDDGFRGESHVRLRSRYDFKYLAKKASVRDHASAAAEGTYEARWSSKNP